MPFPKYLIVAKLSQISSVHVCVHAQSYLTLRNPMDCNPPAPLSMKFSQQEYWSGLPFPPPGDLPDPGIETGSPSLQADSFPSQQPGKPPQCLYFHILRAVQKRFLVICIRFTVRLTYMSFSVSLFVTERKSIINAYFQETKLASPAYVSGRRARAG